MSKYIKLSNDHKELRSALYSQKPRQIKRLSDDVIHYHDWFVVEEVYPTEAKNMNLYQPVRDDWYVDGTRVKFVYRYDLKPVEMRRQYMVDKVNDYRAQYLNQAISLDGNLYDRDEKSMMRIAGATVMAITDSTYQVEWVTANNGSVILTAGEVVKLGKAQAIFESRVINYARRIKDEMLASDSPESIDYLNGWPSPHFLSTDIQ